MSLTLSFIYSRYYIMLIHLNFLKSFLDTALKVLCPVIALVADKPKEEWTLYSRIRCLGYTCVVSLEAKQSFLISISILVHFILN